MVFVVAEHVRRISYSVGAHGLILVPGSSSDERQAKVRDFLYCLKVLV